LILIKCGAAIGVLIQIKADAARLWCGGGLQDEDKP
jgi:hypothetical protein